MLRSLLSTTCLIAAVLSAGCNSKSNTPLAPTNPPAAPSSQQPEPPATEPAPRHDPATTSPAHAPESSASPASSASTPAAPDWMADLASDDAAVRNRASAELAKQAKPAEYLLPYLDHSQAAVRRGAVFGLLSQFDTRDSRQTAAMQAALADGDELVRRVALQGVSQWSQNDPVAAESALEALEAIVKNAARDPFERSQAVRILGRLGSAAQPALVRTFATDADANVRKAALAAVMRTAPAAEQVVKPLIAALSGDSDAAMRRQAARHLKAYAQDRAVQQGLAGAFTDANRDVRLEAAASLGESGPVALDFTASLLDDPNAQVRLYAMFALGKMGRAAEPAIPKLRRLTGDPDTTVAKTAAGVIRVIESSPP